MNLATAYEIQAEASAALGPEYRAEVDPVLAGNLLDSGSFKGVLIIPPPALEYPTNSTVEATWKLIFAAPTGDGYLRAWTTFDAALPLIVDVLGADSARTAAYQANGGKEYPAYEITLVTHHDT